jgi:magnesium chelatase subunit D
MKKAQYPFTAIVEQNALKTALLLNAVDPLIGGVLIRGHKGTGKSTAARGLAQLLPPIETWENCPFNSDPNDPTDIAGRDFIADKLAARIFRPMPFVELPLNATEDRLVGSLHVEKALQTGERKFEPGLLAAANRGILYVDEVNLLPDHLVDMLLDSAASGVNVVEREGISFVHPARFILIGTMNPEEGEVRPQFLDRFGLCVAIETVRDLDSRKKIVLRRLAFENNPEAFLVDWMPAEKAISEQIVDAREHLSEVRMPDDLMSGIVSMTKDLQLQGHRADITILRAARAHAALTEKSVVGKADVIEAARLAIPHRMKTPALDHPDSVREKIDEVLQRLMSSGSVAHKNPGKPAEMSLEEMAESIQVPGSFAAGSVLFSFLGKKHAETVFEPDRTIASAEIELEDLLANKEGGARRAKPLTAGAAGRYRGAEQIKAGESNYRVAVDATLRQAALRTAQEGGRTERNVAVKKEDFRKKRLERSGEKLIVFVVDCSGSMGSGIRAPIRAAKGAVLAILRKARQSRSKVALVAFGGQNADLVLSPTSSTTAAESALERLPAGGGTPFSDSLSQAWQLVRSERLKSPGIRPILVIISDGEANVPLFAGAEPLVELASLAELIARDRIPALFIDAAAQQEGEGAMQRIAAMMHASFIRMGDLTAASVLKAVYRFSAADDGAAVNSFSSHMS